MNTIGFLDSLGRDLRYGLRALRHNPMFAVAACITLAIGIGANTAIFSVVHGVLIKPLPYPNADELVSVWHVAPGLNIPNNPNVSPTMFFTYRESSRTFQEFGLWSAGGASVTGLAEPEQVRTLFVTHGILQALDVQPIARSILNEGHVDRFNLGHVADRLGIGRMGEHGALADAYATYDVLLKLVERALQQE